MGMFVSSIILIINNNIGIVVSLIQTNYSLSGFTVKLGLSSLIRDSFKMSFLFLASVLDIF